MGYVTVTESVGEITKTYHFSSYDDFKDWENKISGVVVNAPEADEDGWIETKGEKPSIDENLVVEVMFREGTFHSGPVGTWVWGNFYEEDDIIKYRVVSK